MPWDRRSAERLGRKIRLRRTELALSQERLGALAGVTKNQIQLIEAGSPSSGSRSAWSNPTVSTLNAIADALGLELSDLVS